MATSFLLPYLLALAASLNGGGDAKQSAARPLDIVCTTGMVGDMVRGIVGDHGQVTTLMGEGVDPHLYKATVSDVRALAKADVVVASGLMLEGRMKDIFPKLRKKGATVIEVGDGIAHTDLLTPEGSHGHPDPHVWMDPALWARGAAHVAKALGARDSAHAAEYEANAKALAAKWAEADAKIAAAIASVEPSRRVLVTAHDAFSYFGRHYSVHVTGIQGVSTESESGLADIRRIIDLLVERGVPAVFVETSVSDKNVRALVEGSMARGHAVTIGGSLFSDAMGKPGTFEGTYVGMITTNAATMVKALGGTPPAAEPATPPAPEAAR